ncbi:hypothetical protein DWV46_07300 [Sellimonas intestinalis]|uniref:Uncharacterized protein n=1 Tax=Sellimonas intestinalis TaxID=1653434 RepID=A0A3E3K3J7_9FIRM|nr:hypothetical protein DW166_05000 [Sellimonas intestinalis]RGE51716.1 hypothetical protein DW871_05185 [Sellimonas intestinalis]RGE54505.1 hypothetical protein DWW28_03175 [Sellimonas intestinalis]RGE61528.1 hypothetical protein DWV46_07300 [Sellimonas intestinalis]RGE88505.1 hypothetical protein DW008_05745 [Sellimonas intestinalis]
MTFNKLISEMLNILPVYIQSGLFLPHKRILFSLHCSDIHVSLYNLGPLITPALCVPLLYHIRHLIQFPDSLQGCPFKCSRIISLSLWLAG